MGCGASRPPDGGVQGVVPGQDGAIEKTAPRGPSVQGAVFTPHRERLEKDALKAVLAENETQAKADASAKQVLKESTTRSKLDLFDMHILPFSVLKALERVPRSHEGKTIRLSEVRVKKAPYLIFFISHRWIRPDSDLPDDEKNSKAALIVEAVEKITGSMVPKGWDFYLWVDYSCVNQDVSEEELEPASRDYPKIVGECHIMLTPVCDEQWESWSMDSVSTTTTMDDYKAPAFVEYRQRARCRLEFFLGGAMPLPPSGPIAGTRCKAGLGVLLGEVKRRPHLVFGTRESRKGLNPILLPFARGAELYQRFNPALGEIARSHDRFVVSSHIETLEKHMTEPQKEDKFVGDKDDKGRLHGLGRAAFADGSRYSGLWRSGKPHGHGVMAYVTGTRYVGEWVEGRRHGPGGEYTLADGAVYVGDWKKDKREGTGTVTFTDGSRYEGGWADNRKHGPGKFFFHHGSWVEGTWVSGEQTGHGIYHHSDGERYEGGYQAGQRQGMGTHHYKDGSRYEGWWDHGKRQGAGTVYYVNGTRFEGEFRGGKEDGQGTIFAPNGAVLFQGMYSKGKRVVGKDTTFVVKSQGQFASTPNLKGLNPDRSSAESSPDGEHRAGEDVVRRASVLASPRGPPSCSSDGESDAADAASLKEESGQGTPPVEGVSAGRGG